MTKNRSTGVPVTQAALSVISNESDDQILTRLDRRFNAMDTMTQATCFGVNRSLIISGPAGLGKSYGVMKTLDVAEQKGYVPLVVKGYIRTDWLVQTSLRKPLQ